MTDYRIVCTVQTGGTSHGHITAVETESNASSPSTRLTVRDVYHRMDSGHTFYTYGGGLRAPVQKWRCSCGTSTLRSGPDATTENNLDSLRSCRQG